jgi:hypothetical protein
LDGCGLVEGRKSKFASQMLEGLKL